MLKSAAILVVPGFLGGIGLIYNGQEPSTERDRTLSPYVVEVGVAFGEAAVRESLPQGLEPAPGFTGGIAIYGGDEVWQSAPLSSGYVWIDLADHGSTDGADWRYLVKGFVSNLRDDASTIPLDVVALGEAHKFTEEGLIHAMAWPDRTTALELVIRLDEASCTSGLSEAKSDLLTAGPGGSLDVTRMPVVLDLCEAKAITAEVSAPADHVLGPLAPERLLWASVATPLRWTMPELPRE